MIVVYWVLGSVSPLYFTYRENILNHEEGKGRGVSWISHGLWAFFMFATAIMEMYMYIKTLE